MRSERKAPASASFVSVASACDDTLIAAKLEFFCCGKTAARMFVKVSNQSSNDSFLDFVFERFVVGYHGSLFKQRSFEKTDMFKKLSTIDPADKKNQKKSKHVDINFAARGTLKKVTEKKLLVNYVFSLSKMIALGFCLLL